MQPFTIHVGKAGRSRIDLDVSKLIDTRLLVCANSGGGKSYLLRGLAEQLAPKIPTIVLDPEGEFLTLREGIDAVLVSRDDGDVRTEAKSAALLARKLLELRLCAIVDLSDLKLSERRRYVRLFLESVMSAPKRLWSPTAILLDEAHQYAPERGASEALDAVNSLMSQGRKRGFAGVLSTQRLSKLHKDAAAEANNVLLGRTTLDLDLRRSCDILQKGKAEWKVLQALEPGEFFAFGPALSERGIVKLKTAKVKTPHPQSGQRHALQAPKPSARIRKVLPEFADLPERAAEEARTLADAQAQIRVLERDLRKAKKGAPVVKDDSAEVKRLRERVASLQEGLDQVTHSERDAHRRAKLALRRMKAVENHLAKASSAVTEALGDAAEPEHAEPRSTPTRVYPSGRAATVTPTRPAPAPRPQANGDLGTGGKRRMLIAAAQMGDDGCDRTQLGLLAGMSPRSGTFSTYLGALKTAGWIAEERGVLVATEAGIEVLGSDYDPLPTGEDLVNYWLDRMGTGGKRRILEVLVEAGHQGLSRAEVADGAGLNPASGTFSTYLGNLRTLKLIHGQKPICAADTLLQ